MFMVQREQVFVPDTGGICAKHCARKATKAMYVVCTPYPYCELVAQGDLEQTLNYTNMELNTYGVLVAWEYTIYLLRTPKSIPKLLIIPFTALLQPLVYSREQHPNPDV
jgi:hypothetical protein